MPSRLRLTSFLIATFLVAIFPACFYGAQARAALQATSPLNGNPNEEHREEHRAEAHAKVQATVRPPPPLAVPQAHARRVPLAPPTSFRSVVSLYIYHPSRFTERWLI